MFQFVTPLTPDNPAAHVTSICGTDSFTVLDGHSLVSLTFTLHDAYTTLDATLAAEHYYTLRLQATKGGGRESQYVTRRVKVLTSAAPVVTIS